MDRFSHPSYAGDRTGVNEKKRKNRPGGLIHEPQGRDHRDLRTFHPPQATRVGYCSDPPLKAMFSQAVKKVGQSNQAQAVEKHGENLVKMATPLVNTTSLKAVSSHQTNGYPPLVAAVAPPPRPNTMSLQTYKVKASAIPILEAIFMWHGDIAAQCTFKTASLRASFLELVCEVVRRLRNSDLDAIASDIEEIESQVSEAEAAKMKVSWLRQHLDTVRKRIESKERCRVLMGLKANTMLVKRAAKKDLGERYAEFMAAQQRFVEAKRCVDALEVVEKKLKESFLECKAKVGAMGKAANCRA